MSKERNISSEQILYLLMDFREKDARRDSFTTIEVNREKCREIGIFPYIAKDSNETRMGRLFLINETHDGKNVDIIYDEKGRFIAWKDYENELKLAQDIELNKQALQMQIEKGMAREINNNTSSSSNNDTTRAGEGRDLANKEHEENLKNANIEEVNTQPQGEKKLENLKGKVDIMRMPQISLETIINGHYLWEILNIEEKLKGKMPDGLSEKSFRQGYLTIIETGEKNLRGENEYKFAVSTYSGDIIELGDDILEKEELGTREERMQKENNRLYMADGKEVEKPDGEEELTRNSKWRIKDLSGLDVTTEEWYLGVNVNREYRESHTIPANGKIMEISFIQEPIEPEKSYERGSREQRTRPSLECKLEDKTEEPLNEKERKQMDQLSKKESNEALNVREQHIQELKDIVEKLTEKYGESYRNTIEKQVEEEHRKGKEPEEIEKDVKDNIDDMENEYYIHGRSRNH